MGKGGHAFDFGVITNHRKIWVQFPCNYIYLQMKSLCVCLTYGRIPFLNRMLSSFLQQDYDDKHLVIINDDNNIQLCCDYKNVICINLNKKILIPQKRNLAVALGYYDIILPMDDDDIFLPSKISNHVNKHLTHPDIWLYRNSAAYMTYENEFTVSISSTNVVSYTRDAWYNIGGYKHSENRGEDDEFFNRMPYKMIEHNRDNIDYVYNWSNINYHMTLIDPSMEDTIEKLAYNQLVNLNLLGGKYYIEPDPDQYNNFLFLDQLWKKQRMPISIKHIGLGKIDISHLKLIAS